MPFEKGHKHATGRPKGSPNKKTQDIRNAYKKFIEDNVPQFQEWIEQVAEKNPAKALELVSNLSDFVLPKLARTEVVGDEEQPLNIDLTKLDDDTLNAISKAINEGEGKS
jgi:hypothetical protein